MNKLDAWMRENRWRNADLARELGIGDAHMGKIRGGTVRPSLPVAVAIEAFTKGAVTPADIERAYTGPKADAALAAA